MKPEYSCRNLTIKFTDNFRKLQEEKKKENVNEVALQ